MAEVIKRKTQEPSYWETFQLTAADIDYLKNLLMEREKPLSTDEMARANERVRLGFIGLGNRGDQVLDAFLQHPDAEVAAVTAAAHAAGLLREETPHAPVGVRVVGPAPCQVTKLHRLFRYHLQLSSPNLEAISAVWKSTAERLSLPPGVELAVDVDPINLR